VPVDVPTPGGPARVTLDRSPASRGLVLLGHSAGGGIDAPDLRRVQAALVSAGVAVGLVEQPYRVAGRRAPAPAAALDAAMLAVAAAVRTRAEPMVFGGRSSGARVACRTAVAAGAVGVLALAFPLRPPWRPEATRLPELTGAGVPALVVQGEKDRFGGARQLADDLAADGADTAITLLPISGADHSLSRVFDTDAVVAWVLDRLATQPE
jgi:predicted alpha/beta-hydrolase family hydrolase